MATGTDSLLHVTCGRCGRIDTIGPASDWVWCPCDEGLDSAARPTDADSLIGHAVGERHGDPLPADGRVLAYRRRRREAVVLNDRAKNVAAISTALALGCWLGAGHSFFLICGFAGAAAWLALHLLTQQLERGRGFSANAIVWKVLSPFSRTGARCARKLRRNARLLRRMGISTS